MVDILREMINWTELASYVKAKIELKNQTKSKEDGEWCAYCNNFSPMAVKNFPDLFLCFGCNTYRNRVILGLE